MLVGKACPHVVARKREHMMLSFHSLLVRVGRIELPYSAWKADVLPLNYTRAVDADKGSIFWFWGTDLLHKERPAYAGLSF